MSASATLHDPWSVVAQTIAASKDHAGFVALEVRATDGSSVSLLVLAEQREILKEIALAALRLYDAEVMKVAPAPPAPPAPVSAPAQPRFTSDEYPF